MCVCVCVCSLLALFIPGILGDPKPGAGLVLLYPMTLSLVSMLLLCGHTAVRLTPVAVCRNTSCWSAPTQCAARSSLAPRAAPCWTRTCCGWDTSAVTSASSCSSSRRTPRSTERSAPRSSARRRGSFRGIGFVAAFLGATGICSEALQGFVMRRYGGLF